MRDFELRSHLLELVLKVLGHFFGKQTLSFHGRKTSLMELIRARFKVVKEEGGFSSLFFFWLSHWVPESVCLSLSLSLKSQRGWAFSNNNAKWTANVSEISRKCWLHKLFGLYLIFTSRVRTPFLYMGLFLSCPYILVISPSCPRGSHSK